MLDTVDLTGRAPVSAGTPWEKSSREPVFSQRSILSAIKPSPTDLRDADLPRLEEELLATQDAPADTEAPPPAQLGTSAAWPTSEQAPRESGVRPLLFSEIAAVPAIRMPDVLMGGELLRARMLVRVTALISVLGAVVLQLVDLPFNLHHVLATAALLASLGTALWVEVVVAMYDSLSRRHHLALGVVAMTALLVMLAYGGVGSPTALLAVLLAHHHAASGRRDESALIACFGSLGIITIGLLSGFAVLTPVGPFVTHAAATFAWSGSLAVMVLVVAWLTWLRARHATLVAQRAQFRVGRREALLDEAYAAVEKLQRPHHSTRSGDHIARYHLEHVIGRGPDSEVYSARDGRHRVAIKLFGPGLDRGQIAHLFSRSSAASTVSPGAARVHDMGYLAGGGFFIVMELFERGDLARRLRDPAPMTTTEAMLMVDELAEGLSRAHESQVFHGNIKPENILQDASGRWRLADFDTPPRFPEAEAAPRYVAPECGMTALCPAGDVFSLAAVAYRVLLRCPPVSTGDPFDTAGRLRPVRPTALAPVPADLDAVFALALASDSRLRMACPLEFARSLRLALAQSLPAWQRERAEELLRIDPYAEPVDLG